MVRLYRGEGMVPFPLPTILTCIQTLERCKRGDTTTVHKVRKAAVITSLDLPAQGALLPQTILNCSEFVPVGQQPEGMHEGGTISCTPGLLILAALWIAGILGL